MKGNDMNRSESPIVEIKRLAWKVGVVYFQIYRDEANPEFYKNLTLKPYERIVEVKSELTPAIQSELSYHGRLPVFGAVSGGWVRGVTDDPKAVAAIVTEARRQVVLPTDEIPEKSKDQLLTLEGPDDLMKDIPQDTD